MLKYYVLVDLVRREEGNEEPLPLPRASPTVTPLSEGQMAYEIDMDEEEELTCDSMQPSIPPAIKVYPDSEPYPPSPVIQELGKLSSMSMT